jgi:hypothetical protein
MVERQLDGIVANQLAVALFAHRAFLVEGTTESSVFYGIADKTSLGSLEAAGVSIVPVGGKTSIPLAHAILTLIGIPVYALFDADGEFEARAKAKGKSQAKIDEERATHVATNRAYPPAREIKFVDTPNSGRIAVATFFIEGFGGGNNSYQFLAVFAAQNIPRTPKDLPYYSLAAVVEVGAGCAVHPRGVRVNASPEPTRAALLSLSFPTFVSSFNGSCNGLTRATYSFDPAAHVGQLMRRN